MGWIWYGGGQALWEKAYAPFGIQPFYCGSSGPQAGGWFRKEIKTVDDFKGLKMRIAGLGGEVLRRLGVNVVLLPPGEVFQAMQSGTIDAAEWIGPADDRNLGLHTIWKNYYLQGLHQSTDLGEVLFNKTWWNKQPADVQAILRGAALASMMETYGFNVYRNAQAIVELREKHGVQILDTPKEFYPEFVKATNIVLDRYAAKDPFFKEVLDSQRNFAKTVVPYWTKILDLYSELGNAALKK
jgi:TRAP-type mannitol/chloroaromatic compound transport system substrate-binding protein